MYLFTRETIFRPAPVVVVDHDDWASVLPAQHKMALLERIVTGTAEILQDIHEYGYLFIIG